MDALSKSSEVVARQSRFFYFVAAIAALNGLLFGYDTGVISGALLFLAKDFQLGTEMQGIVTSIVLVGAVIGAAGSGGLTDLFGSRRLIFFTVGCFIVGTLSCAFTPVLPMLIVGRFVVGCAIGVASFVGPLYLAEIAPARHRGQVVALNQLAITSGIVVSYLVDYLLSPVSDGWRWMFGLAFIPAAGLGLGMIWLPESPRWLFGKGKKEEAKKALVWLRKTDDVEDELREMDHPATAAGTWKDLLAPAIRPALVVGVGLAIFQQVTGINTIIYYAPTIFKESGFASNSSAILATFSVGVINVLVTIVATQLLDRVGRRPLLLWGLAGMVLGLGAMGAAFLSSGHSSLQAYLSLASLMLFVASFAIGLGPVFWLLISEIYPMKVRGRAMSIATMANWGFNLLVALTFLDLLKHLGPSFTFWGYGALSIGAWIFTYYLVPETKGKSLEQIEENMRASKTAEA